MLRCFSIRVMNHSLVLLDEDMPLAVIGIDRLMLQLYRRSFGNLPHNVFITSVSPSQIEGIASLFHEALSSTIKPIFYLPQDATSCFYKHLEESAKISRTEFLRHCQVVLVDEHVGVNSVGIRVACSEDFSSVSLVIGNQISFIEKLNSSGNEKADKRALMEHFLKSDLKRFIVKVNQDRLDMMKQIASVPAYEKKQFFLIPESSVTDDVFTANTRMFKGGKRIDVDIFDKKDLPPMTAEIVTQPKDIEPDIPLLDEVVDDLNGLGLESEDNFEPIKIAQA